MSGVVFGEMLRRNWRGMLLWGSGIGLLMMVRFTALANDQTLTQLTELLETLPPFVTNAFLGGDAQLLATPEGYIAVQIFALLLMLMSAYAAVLGFQVTANDEDRGIMDVQMSLPISRAQLMGEKLAACVLLLIGALGQILFWSWLGVLITPGLSINMQPIALGVLNGIPGTLLVLATTTLLTVLVRRRGVAVGLTFLFVVGSYFANVIGQGAPDSVFGLAQRVSYFTYYDGVRVVIDGLNWGNIAVLLTGATLAAAGAFVLWQRRDIGL